MTKLEERVEFIKNETNYDTMGFPTNNETVIYSCWANIKNMTNVELYKNYTENQKIMISFRVKRCNFTKELIYKTTDYKLRYNNITFNIITAIPTLDKKYVDVKVETVLN